MNATTVATNKETSAGRTAAASPKEQFNIRLPAEFIHAVEGLTWKTRLTRQNLAELGMAVLMGLDKSDASIRELRDHVQAAAKALDIARQLPRGQFKEMEKEMERARRFELPTFTLAR